MYGALMKKKKKHTRQIKIKNGTTKYNKTKAQLGLDVKCLLLGCKVPLQAKRNVINIMLAPQVQRKRIPDLGSAELEGALVLSCPS